MTDKGFYNAEARGVIRGLLSLPFHVLQEARAVATCPSLDRREQIGRLNDLVGKVVEPTFVLDYAYWLPWDDLRPGRNPDDIDQYRALGG